MESKAPDTLRDAILYFADFENCRKFMIELRWAHGKVACPRCGAENVTWLEKARVWKCYAKHERPTFTLKTGTIFEESPIPLEKWLPAAWLVINCKNGISSYELSRDLKVTQKSAWFMLHRIRLAMQNGTFSKLDGEVEVDESFIGGKARNMHKGKRDERIKARGPFGKTVVMGLLERHGEVRATVVPDTSQNVLQDHIRGNVHIGADVFTDAHPGYFGVEERYAHGVIDHAEAYVNGQIHTNGLENFWSLLKRGLNGTYISVEPFHLFRYVDEQVFRYNHRKLTDAERFAIVMKQIVGRRVTYDQLTGKTDDAYS
jgi:transposase-like protein